MPSEHRLGPLLLRADRSAKEFAEAGGGRLARQASVRSADRGRDEQMRVAPSVNAQLDSDADAKLVVVRAECVRHVANIRTHSSNSQASDRSLIALSDCACQGVSIGVMPSVTTQRKRVSRDGVSMSSSRCLTVCVSCADLVKRTPEEDKASTRVGGDTSRLVLVKIGRPSDSSPSAALIDVASRADGGDAAVIVAHEALALLASPVRVIDVSLYRVEVVREAISECRAWRIHVEHRW